MTESAALLAFLLALAATVALTPQAGRLARLVGAVDQPRERGLARAPTPRLGGVAILGGVLAAAAAFLEVGPEIRAILAGAVVITLVGTLDDVFDLSPPWKLAGQFMAALLPVLGGVRVDFVNVPFLGTLDFGAYGGALTLIGLVAVVNVVNFSDGVDGLAAGVCGISGLTFAVLAFDLGHGDAGVLAALTAGAALGFLVHNFHPASSFMGDSGSNLLGLLLGCVAVEGSVKTTAVVALVLPLVVLAVPFLDTGFVVAKRLKHRRAPYAGDNWHFHHRLTNIGFSQRRTVVYLYGWTITMAALALALRFVPYARDDGSLRPGWTLVMAAFALLAAAASVYLVVVLEIVKLRRLRARQLRRDDPDTSEHEIDARVARDLETGELPTADREAEPGVSASPSRDAGPGVSASAGREAGVAGRPARREPARADR
jgi:UDP-GlcNAc:undecaprenyl-phosphate GlcNAc-1-phosphate transferase